MNASIDIPKKRVADFCRKHHINRLALWESGTPDNGRAKAPINVLVEFDPDHIPGLAFFAMQRELAQIFGHDVDLSTPKLISPELRQRVMDEAENVYVGA